MVCILYLTLQLFQLSNNLYLPTANQYLTETCTDGTTGCDCNDTCNGDRALYCTGYCGSVDDIEDWDYDVCGVCGGTEIDVANCP